MTDFDRQRIYGNALRWTNTTNEVRRNDNGGAQSVTFTRTAPGTDTILLMARFPVPDPYEWNYAHSIRVECHAQGHGSIIHQTIRFDGARDRQENGMAYTAGFAWVLQDRSMGLDGHEDDDIDVGLEISLPAVGDGFTVESVNLNCMNLARHGVVRARRNMPPAARPTYQ